MHMLIRPWAFCLYRLTPKISIQVAVVMTRKKNLFRLRITRESVVSAGIGQKIPRDCPVATVGVMESIM